jgi:single-strand DNA-binding protein
MSCINELTLLGWIGEVKELRYTTNDKAVIEVRLATHHGENSDTTWHRCIFFGKQAESVNRHCGKSTRLWCRGRIEHQQHEGKWYTKVICNRFFIVDGGHWEDKPKASKLQPEESPKPDPIDDRKEGPLPEHHYNPASVGAEFEDDIPF